MHKSDRIVSYCFGIIASIAILTVLLIFLFLFKETLPFAFEPGLSKLLSFSWEPTSFIEETFGIIPLITGTLSVTLLASIFAIPLGIIIGVYISEMAKNKEREFLKPFIETLASLPSVVLGFFGLVTICPLVKNIFGLSSGQNALSGSIILAIMAIPTIASISEDALHSTPQNYKDGAFALGARPNQVIWRITIPSSLSGIIASCMLGIGRIIGETIVVLMITGNASLTTLNPFKPVKTMTATIAGEMGEVSVGGEHYGALFAIGFLLLIFTLTLTIISKKFLAKEKYA